MVVKKAIVLLSGGVDSATTLAIARDQGFQVYALSFQYGQKAQQELTAAKKIAQAFAVAEHKVISIRLDDLGGSALTSSIPIPKREAVTGDIPVTYVPARNIIFLSFALAYAETLGASDIFIGANSLDYSGYPDCRPEFFSAFERMANVGTRTGVQTQSIKIHAPLQYLTKSEIIQKGISLGVDFSLTVSCYELNQKNEACGQCESCRIRLKGFDELGIKDPVKYAN
jgi:7-cyano-7-deazaguanine synthase